MNKEVAINLLGSFNWDYEGDREIYYDFITEDYDSKENQEFK